MNETELRDMVESHLETDMTDEVWGVYRDTLQRLLQGLDEKYQRNLLGDFLVCVEDALDQGLSHMLAAQAAYERVTQEDALFEESEPVKPDYRTARGVLDPLPETPTHTESTVVVFPAGVTEYKGRYYNVTIRQGGTWKEALHVIQELHEMYEQGKQWGVRYVPDSRYRPASEEPPMSPRQIQPAKPEPPVLRGRQIPFGTEVNTSSTQPPSKIITHVDEPTGETGLPEKQRTIVAMELEEAVGKTSGKPYTKWLLYYKDRDGKFVPQGKGLATFTDVANQIRELVPEELRPLKANVLVTVPPFILIFNTPIGTNGLPYTNYLRCEAIE